MRGSSGCASVVLAIHTFINPHSSYPDIYLHQQAVQRGAGRSAYQGIGGGGDYMGAGGGFDGGGGCTWIILLG